MAPKGPGDVKMTQAERLAHVKADLRAVHWELGNTKVQYESESVEKFMSENRGNAVRAAIRGRQEPESLQLGKLLRKSHIQLSHSSEQETRTEAKMRFVPQKIDMAESFADTNGAELRKSNIDLAFGVPKTGKEWLSVNRATANDNADAKFAAKKPKGFEMLGEELRKSNVLLHAGRHDFRSASVPIPRSEARSQFIDKGPSPTVGFAETLGKELKTSNIDVAFGSLSKPNATQWQSQMHAIMANKNDDKWACKKPEGFYHLIAELKKTNITLGSDRVVYGSEGAKRPIRDDREAEPAGYVPGL